MEKTLSQLENGTPTDQVITLRSITKTKSTVQPAYDPAINWYAGVERLAPDDKRDKKYYVEPEVTKLTLEDGISFDMNNLVDKLNWEWVKHLPQVAHSFEEAQTSPTAAFYVYIEGKEALKRNSHKDLQFKAEKYVREDSPVNYEDRALLLGFDMSGENPESLKDFLTDMARRTPLKVIQLYESKSISINLLFLKARKKGIIVNDKNVLQYGNIALGINENAALAFLMDKENREILDMLNREVNPELYTRPVSKTSKVEAALAEIDSSEKPANVEPADGE
jgi:hypothetical protein